MNAIAVEDGPYMMRGTGGKKDYLLFAKQGPFGLGIKPNLIAKGKVENTIYVGARIRSAKLPDEVHGDIVDFKLAKASPSEVWPLVSRWDSADNIRASVQIGTFLRGDIEKEPDVLWKALESGKLGNGMAKFLIQLASPEFMMLTEVELVEWLNNYYEPIAKEAMKKFQASKMLDKHIEENVGIFDLTANLHKKVAEEQAKLGLKPSYDKDGKEVSSKYGHHSHSKHGGDPEDIPDAEPNDDDSYED